MNVSNSVLSGTFLAALVGVIANARSVSRASRERERERLRSTLAEAFRAYSDYKEFPYAVRRRNPSDPAGERARLSQELREIQSRLSYYSTWLIAESDKIGSAYQALLIELRSIAGGSIQSAWLEDSAKTDADMNIGKERVDLSALKTAEEAFLKAIKGRVRVKD